MVDCKGKVAPQTRSLAVVVTHMDKATVPPAVVIGTVAGAAAHEAPATIFIPTVALAGCITARSAPSIAALVVNLIIFIVIACS